MSILDLSQLWMNIGGNCPYLEINLQQIKNKIYLVLKEYFNNPNDGLMKKIASMTWQNKDYFELNKHIIRQKEHYWNPYKSQIHKQINRKHIKQKSKLILKILKYLKIYLKKE